MDPPPFFFLVQIYHHHKYCSFFKMLRRSTSVLYCVGFFSYMYLSQNKNLHYGYAYFYLDKINNVRKTERCNNKTVELIEYFYIENSFHGTCLCTSFHFLCVPWMGAWFPKQYTMRHSKLASWLGNIFCDEYQKQSLLQPFLLSFSPLFMWVRDS